jgi:hypothetical protein
MSRVLKVSQNNYRLQTASGGTITLDTGVTVGTVIVTGNLDVKGVTTTIESSNININDNILFLNSGQTGNGISSTLNYVSGIEIVRGNLSNASFFFNDSVTHYNPVTSSNVTGTFQLKTIDGALSGLQVGTITNDGSTDLVFDMQSGSHALLIANSSNYASLVTSDNHIPNKKFITNYVAASNGVATVDRMVFPTTASISTAQSSIEAFSSNITFKIGVNTVANLSNSGFTVNDVNIWQDTITNTSANNLILSATTNNVEVNSILNLDDQSSGNISSYGGSVSGKTKIYSSATAGPGKTGLYISNVNTTDELVSKNRAVLLSILL